MTVDLGRFERVFFFDTETFLIAPGMLAPPLVCLTCCDIKGPASIYAADEARAPFEAALDDPGVLLVGQNIAFDLAVLCARWPDLLVKVFAAFDAGRVSDTQIREKLIAVANGGTERLAGKTTEKSPGRGYSLSAIVYRRLGINLIAQKSGDDIWRLRYGTLANVPVAQWPAGARQYALDDAVKTRDAWLAQAFDIEGARHRLRIAGVPDEQIDPVPFMQDERARAAFAFALHLAGCWGLRTDPERVRAMTTKLLTRLREVDDVLISRGLVTRKGRKTSRNMKQIKALVTKAYASIGEKPPKTKGGDVSTARDTLRAVAAYDDVIEVLIERDELALVQSRYLEHLITGTQHPLNPAWNVLVNSGRSSAADPPVQQLPKWHDPIGLRRAFVARPGYVFIRADYPAAESQALAQICLWWFAESRLADVFKRGHDLHYTTAASLLKEPYDAICYFDEGAGEWKPKGDTEDKVKRVKLMRQLSKALIYGVPGGLGAVTFCAFAYKSYKIKITPAEFKQRKAELFAAYPELRLFHGIVNERRNAGGKRGFDLVQLVTNRLRGECEFCDGANSYFQGLVADFALFAFYLIQQESYTGYSEAWTRDEHVDVKSPLYGSKGVLFMHDECVAEAPEQTAAAAGDRLAFLMDYAARKFCPDLPFGCQPIMSRDFGGDHATRRSADGTLMLSEIAHA